ncbi:Imm1 family immunity protein [Actinokineospora sp. 24-640]
MGFVLEVAYKNDAPVRRLRTVEDIDEFVAELLEAGWEHESASVYALPSEDTDAVPDHEVIIGARKGTGLGVVRYSGGAAIPGDDSAEWFSVGERVSPDGVEYSYFGTGHDFPGNSEVPLDVVKAAMAELLVNGGKRPTCVVWQGR